MQGSLIQKYGNRYVQQTSFEISFVIDLHNTHQALNLLEIERTGGYELATTNFLIDKLKEGSRFVDVGANYGYFSLVAANLVGHSGQVLAFEPLPSIAQTLRANAALNGFENIQVIQAVACNENGKTPFFVSGLEDGMSSLIPRFGDRKILVNAFRLDSVLPRVRFDVVKVDVEGVEESVLLGAQELIGEGYMPSIIVEWNVGTCARFSDLDKRFAKLGKFGEMYVIEGSANTTRYRLRGPIKTRKDLPPACNVLLRP